MKSICKEIYQNSRFKNSEIIKLIFNSFSKDLGIRCLVALNPSAPTSTLDYLSKDENYSVRIGVALNPTYKKYKEENGL